MLGIVNTSIQPRADPGGAIGAIAPLKPSKVTLFTMILCNWKNRICDI